MEQLKAIFDKFEAIKYKYCGRETDWKERHKELESLYKELQKVKIRESKNSLFYGYVKRGLSKDIFEESKRVWQLSFKS